MTIDELMQMIDDDLTLNQSNLQDKLYKIPNYHSKYLRLFFEYKNKLIKEEQKLNVVYRDLYHYYNGVSSECYEYTLDKKEVQFHLLADEKYIEQNLKVEKLKLLVSCLDMTIKKVNYMSQDVKSILGYLSYLNGV
jgi:hypothetical protein